MIPRTPKKLPPGKCKDRSIDFFHKIRINKSTIQFFLITLAKTEWALWERMLAGPMGRVSISSDAMESLDELPSTDSGVVVLNS